MNSLTTMCSTTKLERVLYFPRQLITADDMRTEQDYFREKLRRHNRYLHGWGVVCGCEVKAAPTAEHPWQVTVSPGYVLTPQGDEIEIPRAVEFDLAGSWRQAYDPCSPPSPCSPSVQPAAGTQGITVYLAVCYTECSSRPVRIHPAGCGCDEATCEYSRIRDSFELVRLSEWPESHRLAAKADAALCKEFQDWITSQGTSAQPVPSCAECSDDACVVLAKIILPDKRTSWIGGTSDGGKISYDGRRVLYSTRTLQELCACIPHTTSEVSVKIQPETANLAVGGTQQFTATVTGSTNTAVSWSVQEGAAGGIITGAGLYTAPQAAGAYQVVATSQADPTKSDTVTVTVVAAPISVSIQPHNADLYYGFNLTQQFTAIVTGSNNQAVTWSVKEGTTYGTISATGLFTALPAAEGYWQIHVVATSQADPTKSDIALVTAHALN